MHLRVDQTLTGVHGTDAQGAPGDSNHLLTALLQYSWPGAGAMCAMVSPSAVATAEAAGVGASLSIPLGGVMDVSISAYPTA
jgi:microcystin degradation protein MlrC